eukprot:XP_014784769.1 PREDICTED: cyclin-T1-like [Octopus bimaculoides]
MAVLKSLLFIVVLQAVTEEFKTGCPWEPLYTVDEPAVNLEKRFQIKKQNLVLKGIKVNLVNTKILTYLMMTTELVRNENILLQTLGFDLTVDHPHTHVVKTCQMVRASKDLAQTSYFLATNSLHLTTMCLMYKPTVVACVCIHLASRWGSWELQSSAEGKPWYSYVEKSVTPDLLEELTIDFLEVLDGCPTRLKKKIMTWRSGRDKDEDKDKDGPPEKKSRLDIRGTSNSTATGSSPGPSAESDFTKERLNIASSPSDRKVRFKVETPVKVLSQPEKSSFPLDSTAVGVPGVSATHAAASAAAAASVSSSSSSSNPKLDQRKKMHKSSVPRADSKSLSDRHSHIVRPHQNAPLKLTIKTPIPPCDGEAKLPGSSQVSGKWSNQNRLKLDNHTGSANVSMKQLHNSKVDYPPLDRMKDVNHMVNMKGHIDSYSQKSVTGRIDPMLQSSATSSKSHFNPNNAYPVVNPSCTSNDVQFDSTYRNSARRQKVCDTSLTPYKSGSKQQQLSASQSLRYNSYCQGSDLRLDNEKLIGHSLESNGSGPSNLHSSQALTNPLPSSVTTASASNATGGREQFGELQMQIQQLIDIQKKNIREHRQKYTMDLHK